MSAPAVSVRARVRNFSGETWSAEEGYAAGYQVFDPDSGTLVVDGARVPLEAPLAPGASAELDLEISLPPEPGRYRVFVSSLQEHVAWHYARGASFLALDAEVENGRARIVRARETTLGRLRRENLARAAGRAFEYPLRTLWRNRALIRSMVRRDILGRYRGSFGGVFWTVLNPLILMVTYFFVFGVVLRTRTAADPSLAGFALYFLCGMLPWLAFSEAVGRAPFIVLEYRTFVKRLVFPLEILPVNLTFSALVTELVAAAIFAACVFAARGTVPATVLWLPALVMPQVLFTMGLCWCMAALGVYVRDLGQINGFLLTLWFFLTPICYPAESLAPLPPRVLAVLSANPLFILVRGYRRIFLESAPPDFGPLWKLWLFSAALFLLGHAWFYKLKKSFADVM
jgi:lipopolysaccharide transport system permease protein